jgi:hypothetical protein
MHISQTLQTPTMLYIKFKIPNQETFTDFQKLYLHMVEVRTPDFEFDDKTEEINWAKITEAEMEAIFDENLQQEKRYEAFFPDYANTFLERYLQFDNDKAGALGLQGKSSIMNYLEHDFEVDMNNLEKLNEDFGLVEFSTGNYPYGGLQRFLMVLKAFKLIPAECFNGFTIYEFDWVSDFVYNSIEFPEKTKEYLKLK